MRIPVADFNLLAVPEELDDERAIFLGDILTTGVYAAGIAGIRPGDTVAVIGAGPVGFFAAQAAKLHDPEQILVLDMQEDRLALAEKVGATAINVAERNAASAVDELTEGRGADVVIECVGNLSAFESAVGVVRRGGIVCIVGVYSSESTELQLGHLLEPRADVPVLGGRARSRPGGSRRCGPCRTARSIRSRSSPTPSRWTRRSRATGCSTRARRRRSC